MIRWLFIAVAGTGGLLFAFIMEAIAKKFNISFMLFSFTVVLLLSMLAEIVYRYVFKIAPDEDGEYIIDSTNNDDK